MSWGRKLRAAFSRAALVAALAGLFGGVFAAAPAVAAPAEAEPAYVTLVASATPAPPTAVAPGGVITFTFSLTCFSDVAGCVDLKISDELPDPLVLENVSMSSSTVDGEFATTADSFELTFTNDLGGGQIGLPDGHSVEFIATARVPSDVAADFDGDTIVNEAFATLAYAASNTSDAVDVLLAVPTTLGSTAGKSATPATVNAVAGAEVEYRLAGSNDSNTGVDALVLQDPAVVGSSPFHYLAPAELAIGAWPSGADRVQVDWYDGSSWRLGAPVASPVLPTPGSGEQIAGLRFTFTSSTGGTIARDAAAEVVLGTVARALVADIDTSATVTNVASSWVGLASATSSPVSDSASVRIDAVAVSPAATKTFTPDSLVGGRDVEVGLRAENGGDFDLARLTVTEPATGSPDLLDQGLSFVGWVDDEVQWPVGATSAAVSFWYDGDADFASAVTVARPADLPDPSAGAVRAVRVVFSGDMAPGQYAVLTYTAGTATVDADVTTTGTMAVDAVTTGADPLSAATTAADDLTLRTARVDARAIKTATPSALYAVPGASSVVSITAGVAPVPTAPSDAGGSTVGATSLVITDPASATPAFWEAFGLTRILATDVPAGSRLTVEYLDTRGTPTWTQLDTATGPALYARVLTTDERENLGGIRFVYEPVGQDELPPGFTVAINLRVALLAAGIEADATVPYPVENVVAVAVENPATTPASASRQDDAVLTLTPVDGGGGAGGLPMVDKAWADDLVSARSGDDVTATISWGTGGLEYPSVVVADSALDPADAGFDVADTVYDAFDLVSIPAISASEDPLLTFDAVTAVELFVPGSGWVAASGNPCAGSACDGRFPGYVLTQAERETAIGARLVIEESPTRAARIDADDPYAPATGTGVASTTARDREIDLVFRLRDERRSDGAPVLGGSRGMLYNTATPGEVENSARVEGRDAGDAVVHSDDAADVIQILDRPLNVIAAMTWTGGPLGAPDAGTPAELFPSARVTATATNATVVPVDGLALTEPGVTGGGSAPDPFDAVDLLDIVSISVPTGATSTSVILGPSSAYPSAFTLAAALALTATELADATSIRVEHSGRIEPGAQTVVVLDTRLREHLRSDPGTRVGIPQSPVANSVLAEVSDLGGLWSGDPAATPAPGDVLTAEDDAQSQLTIEDPDPAVVATLLISAGTQATDSAPAIQYDGSAATATVSLRGQPAGNVRYTEMILESASPTFWNAYAFTGFASHSFASPLDRVQVDALIDADYTDDGGSIVSTAGTWVIGSPRTSLALPTGVLPAQVRGLRVTYTRDDGAAWERPYNPRQTVSFTVTRRDDLLTGGPVPSTLYIHDPGIAPGETERATFTDALEVTVNARETAGGPVSWTASDTDGKQLRYQHLPAKVEIRTSPTGDIALGDTIGYRIGVHNFGGAGDRALSGVVVTDLLPVDGTGDPYLVFAEDPATGVRYDPNVTADAAEIFSFELRDAAGVLQPTPAVGVVLDTVETSPGVEQPRLTFSVGGTIEPGFTLTVFADMEFRPQLEAGTAVTSTATVVSDQEFDSCGRHYVDDAEVAPGSLGAVPPYLETASCSSTTTVRPLPSAPLSVTKGVKGIAAGPLDAAGDPLLDAADEPYADLGVVTATTAGSVDCSAPNTAITVDGEGGYYRYPCVPITRPGATEEWAATFVNSGNVSVRQIVAIDALPRPDDTGVTIATPRGSQWTARLASYPVAHGLPANAELRVYYTDQAGMASARCNGADIQDTIGMSPTSTPPMQSSYQSCLTDTGAIDDLPNREWLELPADPAVWSSVVALKFVVQMNAAAGLTDLLGPGAGVTIAYRTTTALAPEIGNPAADLGLDVFAYNSVAAAATGRIYEGGSPLDLAYRLVTEPRKAGVALAVGGLELLKVNEGAAAGYAPSSVSVSLACTVEVDGVSQPITLLDSARADRSTVTLVPGTTKLVEGIPLYADCSVTEADDYGRTTVAYSPDPASVVAQAAATVGRREVSAPHPEFGPARPAVERATITNSYAAAHLTVSKTVDTSGAVNQDGTPIAYTAPQFSVSCRFDNGVTNPVIFSVTGLTIASGASVTFPRAATSDPVLPAGAVCTVTESNTRNATSTRYTVTTAAGTGSSTAGSAATVTLTADDGGSGTNSVAFLNTYGVGSLTVSKTVAGLGAAAYGTGDFTVSVSCTRASATPSTVWSGTFTLSATDPTRVIPNLPAAAVCTVTEPNSAGATSTSFSPQQPSVPTAGRATVPNGSATTVTITNTFDLARVAITKDVRTDAVDQDGDPVYPVDTFDIDVTCTWQGGTVVATGFALGTMHLTDVARGETRTLAGLPAGASCVVEEVGIPGDVDSTSIAWQSATASASVSGATATFALTRDPSASTGSNTVTVINRYDVGALTVTKDLQGGASAQFGVGPFRIAVECVAPGGVTAYADTIDLPTAGGAWFRTIEDLPDGSVCSVAETGVAATGADAMRLLDGAGEPFDGTGIEVSTAAAASVTIENWYLTGALTVGKSTEGDGGGGYGAGPFEVTLDCVREVDGTDVPVTGFPQSRSLVTGATTTFTGLPSTAECTLTETDAGGATSSRIVSAAAPGTTLSADVATGYTFTVVVDPATLADDQAQPALGVVNVFELAGLVVTKTVQSDAVEQDGAEVRYGPFPVEVACTFEGRPVYATGYDADTPMTRDFAEGDPAWELDGLVAGAVCEVAETDRRSAASSRIAMTPTGGSTATSFASPSSSSVDAEIVLAPPSAGEPDNLAAIRNDYESGTISLEKVVTGAGAAWATEQFAIRVVCTLADGPVDPVVWDETYVVTADDLAIDDLERVAAGASCVVTETRTGGATATTITVDADVEPGTSATFTSPAGATPVAISVVNTFELAELAIAKERVGDPDILNRYGLGPFEVTATCTREVDGDTLPIVVPGGATRALTAAGMYEASFAGLPAGADCTVVESLTGGANASSVTPGTLTLASGVNDVDVVNEFTSGSVAVTKTIDGAGAALYGTGPFYVALACTRDVDGVAVAVDVPAPATPIDGVTDPAVRELSAANSYVADYLGLPTGADCEIVETGTGGATTTAIDVPSFTIGDGVAQAVEVTNTFEIVDVVVTNHVTGNAAAPKLADDFVIELECELEVNDRPADVAILDGPERAFKHAESVEYTELPVGAECGLTETDDRGASRVSIMQGGDHVELFTLALDPAGTRIDVVNVFVAMAVTGDDSPLLVALAALALIGIGGLLAVLRRTRPRHRAGRLRA